MLFKTQKEAVVLGCIVVGVFFGYSLLKNMASVKNGSELSRQKQQTAATLKQRAAAATGGPVQTTPGGLAIDKTGLGGHYLDDVKHLLGGDWLGKGVPSSQNATSAPEAAPGVYGRYSAARSSVNKKEAAPEDYYSEQK